MPKKENGMKKTTVTIIAAGLIVMGSEGAAYAIPVFTNGSFENYTVNTTYPLTPDLSSVTFNGWVAGNPSNRLDVFTMDGYNGSEGDAALRVHTTIDGAHQTLTGFTPGQSYTLMFDMAATGVWYPNHGNWYNQSDAGQGVDVLVDGNSIGSALTTENFDASAVFGSNPFDYTTYSLNFTASAANLTFTFNVLNDGTIDDGGVAIDNLRLSEAAPVPEPTTILLFGTGLAGLAGLRRRQGKK